MILQESIDIGEDEDAGSVHDRLMVLGASMIMRTTDLIAEGMPERIPQPELKPEEMPPAPKIFRETCMIDFNKNAREVHNFIRGLAPYPAAWCEVSMGGESQTMKIFRTSLTGLTAELPSGTILTDRKSYIRIACADQWIEVKELQLPNKKRMNTKEMLNGLKEDLRMTDKQHNG